MKRLLFAIASLALLTGVLLATTTYVAPGSNTPRNRFYDPHSGITAVDLVLTSADQTVTLDPTMAGNLIRVVYWANGNDAAYSIIVKDASTCTLFSKTDCTSVGDPFSYIVTSSDQAGNSYGGAPFVGGLTVQLANADTGTTTEVDIRLYISEQWRR